MKKQRQNVQLTKAREQQTVTDKIELRHALTKQNLMVNVIDAQQTVYSDQTGRFPVQSSRGNRLLMLIYDVDGNYIDVEPMKDNKDNSMIKAYEALWGRITKLRKNKPSMHIFDNKASTAFKAAIKQNCNLQLVPPNNHCCNLAERAIQTFKSHLLQFWWGSIQAFPCTYGIDSCHKQCLHSICSDKRKTIRPYWHTSMSTEHLITIKCHLHC
jgi:hypothetical protein